MQSIEICPQTNLVAQNDIIENNQQIKSLRKRSRKRTQKHPPSWPPVPDVRLHHCNRKAVEPED